jgi:integrase
MAGRSPSTTRWFTSFGHFPPLLQRAGVEGVRFHDLRHTVATMLMGSVHPKVVSELLGHSDVATTLRVYSHAAAAMHQEAADTLDALVGADGG